ncbi:5-(carboxyamino)imidazole ribonucleotide mutase [Tepidibacillus marianensis]|uniref:5-(carboxyamino)imidazole ribonucleotide mutase n=1 Tax=Tepidibacillus marianensis TaxID=3131995 RepID=UPI00338FEEE0
MPKVLIVVGSDSDLLVMKGAIDALIKLEIPYEIRISSAHRVPERTVAIAKEAEKNGVQVIIAGAGMAAHLPGVIAAYTTLPVIGVPIQGGAIQGIDALYAIVQMPKGIPVATVAVNGAFNAGLLAAQMMALADSNIAKKLKEIRQSMANEVEGKDQQLQGLGIEKYIAQ